MTTPALADVPVRSALALTRRWLDLLQPPTFGARSLWLAWFDADGRQSPVLVPVDDLPVTPDPSMFEGLRLLNETVVSAQLGDDSHLAMALCRPGEAVVSDSDDEWVDALGPDADRSGLRIDGDADLARLLLDGLGVAAESGARTERVA